MNFSVLSNATNALADVTATLNRLSDSKELSHASAQSMKRYKRTLKVLTNYVSNYFYPLVYISATSTVVNEILSTLVTALVDPVIRS